MKKALLTLSAALVAGSGMATSPRIFCGNESQTTPEKAQSLRTDKMSLMEVASRTGLNDSRSGLAKSPRRLLDGGDIITQAPAGETVYYERSFYGFYVYGFWIVFGQSSSTSNVVYGDDGYAYIKNPFGGWQTNSYLKCEVKGDKLVATLPQLIYQEESYEEEGVIDDYYATLLYNVGTQEEPEYAMAVTDDIKTVSWTVDGDKITLDMEYDATPDENGYLQYPDVMFGMVNTEGEWTIAGDCGQTYTKVELNPVVPPAGLVTEDWVIVTPGQGIKIDVGFDGDDVYLSNLDSAFPDAYVKGKFEGDKVRFESKQYLGEYAGFYIYFMGGTYDEEMYYLADDIALDYDAGKKVLSAPEGECIILNAALDRLYYYKIYEAPMIKAVNPNPNPEPLAPVPSAYYDYFEDYGYTYFAFSLPNLNADDDLIDTSNMYYEVYIDGELMTFYTDEYYVEEDIEQIPYDFTDGDGIFASGVSHSLYFYFTGFETIGVRLYNEADGVVYPSPMTVFNVNTLDWWTEKTDGISTVNSGLSVSGVEYYNLQGMKLERPAPGVNVCRATMSDGTVKVTKVMVK